MAKLHTLVVGALALLGCDPEPPNELGDEASTESGESGPVVDLPGDLPSECEPDSSGIYLLALETALGPDSPILFVVTLDAIANDDCTSVATFAVQPLGVDLEFVGDPLVFPDVEFDANGEFMLDMGIVMITGAANPITDSDITASLVLTGHVVHADALCGDVTGMLMSPLEYDLAGSTFGAIRLADDGSDPATLPGFGMFPYNCSQVPPP